MRWKRAFSMLLGAFATYVLPLNPVLSSALVGAVFALFLPSLALPAYIGSFIGMSAEELVQPLFVPVAVAVSATLFELVWERLPSLGGKAGFIAFLGVVTVLLLSGKVPEPRDPLVEFELVIALFAVSALGVVLTYKLRQIAPGNKVVFAASAVGTIAGLLYYIRPELGEVLYAGAFAGMGPKSWGESEKTALLVGVLVALVYVLTYHLFPGVGGKLGTVAFLGSIIALLLYRRA